MAIEDDLDHLNTVVADVEEEVRSQNLKNRAGSKRAALEIGGSQFVPQGDEGYRKSVEAAGDIEEILGKYYDTLKWIQGSAVDL